MHHTSKLYILKRKRKRNKILHSGRFCPAVHCHGSQTPRFIWCPHNKLDFLGLVCMHIALEQLQIIEATMRARPRRPPQQKHWKIAGGGGVEMELGSLSVYHPVSWDIVWTQAKCSGLWEDCVCVWSWTENQTGRELQISGKEKTFTWDWLQPSFIPLSTQLLAYSIRCISPHAVSTECVKFDANFSSDATVASHMLGQIQLLQNTFHKGQILIPLTDWTAVAQ